MATEATYWHPIAISPPARGRPDPEFRWLPTVFGSLEEGDVFYLYYPQADYYHAYTRVPLEMRGGWNSNAMLVGEPGEGNPKYQWFAEDRIVFVDRS